MEAERGKQKNTDRGLAMLFNHNIKNIKDWAGIFQDKTAFAPLVKEIFRRHGLDFTGIDSCTPGSNAVFRSGGFIVKIFASY